MHGAYRADSPAKHFGKCGLVPRVQLESGFASGPAFAKHPRFRAGHDNYERPANCGPSNRSSSVSTFADVPM